MSKQSISWLLVVIVAIGIIFFAFIRPSSISSPNGAAVITTEAERQAMIDKINADIANYQKLIDELNVQIKDVQNTPTPIPPTFTPTVTVTPTTSTLAKSKTLQLTASYKDETGAVVPKTFTWSTSSGTIATVSSKGLVTARNVGTATITATTGTVKGTASITVTVPDTTRPNVSITSPKAGTVSGTIDVTATASDNVAVTKVEIYSKNGTTNALVKTFTAPPYTVSINTTLSTDGARYLTAKAYDAAGNSRTSTAVSITIKNAVATPTGSCPTTIPSNSFLSCFYSYSSAANFGSFLASRTGTTIDYNWGALSPMTGVPIDLFSMRSTGNFTFESATYTFTHTGDDGTRLFIDNVKVDEQWNDHAATTYTIDKAMTAGTHKVTLEYYENGGDAVVALSWAKKVVDAVACTTAPTETQTSACPTGQTGTVTKTRTTSPAPACTLSAWVTTDTCVAESTGTLDTTMPNEPKTGGTMQKLLENAWDCVTGCSNGWSYADVLYSNATTVVSSATPKGDGKFAQMNFTSQVPAGSSPSAFKVTPPQQKQDIYVATWIKLSTDYRGNDTTVNKVLHFWTRGGKNNIIFVIRGAGFNDLIPSIGLQGIYGQYTYTEYGEVVVQVTNDAASLNPNLGATGCKVVRGQWHKYEMFIHNSSPGGKDGTVELWMDGVKCIDYRGIPFTGPGENNKLEELWWSPTWGGNVGTIGATEVFEEQMDHIYVSGRDPVVATSPAGWTKLADRDFSTLTASGWGNGDDVSKLSIATDSSAPSSDKSVMRMLFPAGFGGGSSSSNVYYPGFSYKKIRVDATLMYPTNYQGHSGGTNKIIFMPIGPAGGQNLIYTSAWGGGVNNNEWLTPGIGLQGIRSIKGQGPISGESAVSINLFPNLVPSARMIRGKWHVFRVEASGGTAGVEDGTVDWWLDGVQIGSYDGIKWFDSGDSKFHEANWAPIWGGGGDSVSAPMYEYLDHMTIYGSN